MINNDLKVGLKQLTDKADGYRDGDAYYSGDTKETFTGKAMARQLAKSGDLADLRLNFSKVVVDSVLNRIELESVSSPDESAQAALASLWDANQLDLELPNLFQRTLVYGDAFLILDGDADQGVSLFYNSPLNVQIIFDDENPRLKRFAIKRWYCTDPTWGSITRVNLYYPDRIERYWAKEKSNDPKEFAPFTSADPADSESVIANPYGFIPVYRFMTSLDACPEHKEAYGPQDAINKLAIIHLATVDYQGFPQRYLMANDPLASGDIDDFDADIFHDQKTPNATSLGPDLLHPSVVPTSGLRAEPGGVWTLPSGSTAGQFAAASSKDFLDSMETYIRIMAQVTSTPVRYFDGLPGNVSGETLRVSDAPLLKKVSTRIAFFQASLQDVFQDVLMVLGIPNTPLAFRWESGDDEVGVADLQVAQAKVNLGVTRYEALRDIGYSDDQLKAMRVHPDSVGTETEKIQRLADIGKALQGLGVAVNAGIIPAETVQNLVISLLAETQPDA